MVVAGRTREQLRVAVGRHLGAVYVSLMTVNTGTITGTAVNKKDFNDNTLFGGNDDHNGNWLKFTNGSNDGRIARVKDYIGGTIYRIIVRPDVTGANFAIGDTYEMWDRRFEPARIEEFINQAILDATGRLYHPEESLALHADGVTSKFAIPSEFAMLSKVEVRTAFETKSIHQGSRTWDEKTDADFTVSVDTKDYKLPKGSLKIVVVAAAAAADSISDSITSINLSRYDYVEL